MNYVRCLEGSVCTFKTIIIIITIIINIIIIVVVVAIGSVVVVVTDCVQSLTPLPFFSQEKSPTSVQWTAAARPIPTPAIASSTCAPTRNRSPTYVKCLAAISATQTRAHSENTCALTDTFTAQGINYQHLRPRPPPPLRRHLRLRPHRRCR